MANEKNARVNQLHDLLPAYVSGKASLDERQWIKDILSKNADARAALAWHEALSEKVIADIDGLPSDIGWSKLQARVNADVGARYTASFPSKAGQAPSSWIAWITDKLAFLMPHNLMPAPALSGVCALLVAIVATQFFASSQQDSVEYSLVRGGTPSTGLKPEAVAGRKYVKLNFKDRITERDMRLLLVRTGAVIVDGPGQLGDYTVALPADQLDVALKEFQNSLLTESVQQISTDGSSPKTSDQTKQYFTQTPTTSGIKP